MDFLGFRLGTDRSGEELIRTRALLGFVPVETGIQARLGRTASEMGSNRHLAATNSDAVFLTQQAYTV